MGTKAGLHELPHGARDFGHELQLPPLILLGQQISFRDGREAALRADREMLERALRSGRFGT